MARKLYVGNLSPGVGHTALEKLFAAYGAVKWVTVVTEPATGRSEGFGFVEMSTDAQTQAAITGLNGKRIAGRVIQVSEAQSRKNR